MKRLMTVAALALLAGAAGAQTFTVTGLFEYEDKGWGYNGWNGNDPLRPIRRADVSVINDGNGAVLATGSTADDGSFSLQASSLGVADIVVRVDCDTNNEPVFQRVRVTTESNAEYQSFSPVFAGHDTNLDLDIGAVLVPKTSSSGLEANPFNMLDMGVSAWEYITGPAGAGNAPQTIRIYWPGGSGSFATGNQAHMATDDGYDDAVILHELGHVAHNMYSDSDSPGGSHFFGDSDQDPRLSFGEGFATFFAGQVFDTIIDRQAIYMDANGASQNGGAQLRLRLETVQPYSGDARGAADEVAVACTLFDLIDSEDSSDQSNGSDDDPIGATTTINGASRHEAWWDVLTGPVASAANLNINHAWDGWFSEHGVGGLHSDLVDVYGALRLDFFDDVDEPNDSFAEAAPVAAVGSWVTNRTLYDGSGDPPAPGLNDTDFYVFDAVVGSVVDIETRYPGNAGDADTQCDTDMDLRDPSNAVVASDSGSGTGRNAAVLGAAITETGPWTFRVRSVHSYREYGRYDYRVSYVFENQVPVITSAPVAAPASIDDASVSTLSATASDPNAGQALSFAWTPLSGGTIVGSGPAVSFDPPTVGVVTEFDVQLVVSDPLGAESAPELVTITVTPSGPICGAPASVVTGGSGKAGQSGVPLLTAVNLPVVPNSDFGLQLSNALPGGTAYLILGLTQLDAPFDLGTMHPTPDLILTFPIGGTGDLFLPLPSPDDPILCGLPVTWQVMVPDDPGAAGFRQTAQTGYVQTIGGT